MGSHPDVEVSSHDRHHLALSEAHGIEPGDLDLGLWDVFTATARLFPKREAVVSLWQEASIMPRFGSPLDRICESADCLRLSYEELLISAEALARPLEGLGCKPRVRLVALLWNSAEWTLCFWVAARLNMAFVPIDPRNDVETRSMLSSFGLQTQVAVFAQHEREAALFDAVELAPLVRIQCSGVPRRGWTSLSQLQSSTSRACRGVGHASGSVGGIESSSPLGDEVGDGAALVVFTSGTTGSPRGCPHTSRNLMSQSSDYDPNADPASVDRWLVHTPVSHIFAINNAIRAWRYGGTVVFASKSFEVGASAKALVQEQCTIMSATPTLVKSLLAQPSCPSPDRLSLKLVTIAGTRITADDVQLCRQGLGAENATQAYGMSEGAPLISWARSDPRLVDGFCHGVGTVLPGVKIRVCDPSTGEIVARGAIGELHVAGASVISGYASEAAESFYEDANSTWLRTGDQARMAEDGVVDILGRYKDIIIMGGENISPVGLEMTIYKLCKVKCHIVGIPDDIAGEIPVAILDLDDGLTKQQAVQLISQNGQKTMIGGFYTLQEIGCHKVPVTALGKVKKHILRQATVKAYSRQRNEMSPSCTDELTIATRFHSPVVLGRLRSVWEQLTGIRAEVDEDLLRMADSITLLRYCDEFLRVTGQRLYLPDLAKLNTLSKQANRIKDSLEKALPVVRFNGFRDAFASIESSSCASRKATEWVGSTHSSRKHHHGVLAPQHSEGNCSMASVRSHLCSLGLGPLTVEDMFPIRESQRRTVAGQREQSFHVRLVHKAATSPQLVRDALEICLSRRPLFRAVRYQSASGHLYHVVLQADPTVLDQVIHLTPKPLVAVSDYWQETLPRLCSPWMFRADIIESVDAHHSILAMTYNHSTVDAIELTAWHADLEKILSQSSTREFLQTPYRHFADLASQFQTSLAAKMSVHYHVGRLRGLTRFPEALWPRQRAPGWMISCDEDSPYAEERARCRGELWRGKWTEMESSFRFPRSARVVRVSTLPKLLKTHDISAENFTRAALAIFNVLETGSSLAVFSTWESGRSWPFVTDWLEKLLPSPMSVCGPMAEWVLNAFEVMRDEPVREYLRRHAAEHLELQRHVHAPWEDIVREMGDEGRMVVDASFRQSFVWDVSLDLSAGTRLCDKAAVLKPVARYDWADSGIFWNAYAIDDEHIFFVASWDTAQMNDVEINGHCDRLADVLRKLGEESCWDATIGETFVRGAT